MPIFLKKISWFVLIVFLLWLLHFLVLLGISELRPARYDLIHKAQPVKGKTVFLFGNSHVECGINDSLLGSKYLNLGKSGEPLFYTVIKAKQVIEQLRPDTILIGFDNLSIETINWVLADDRLLENYKNYFSRMTLEEHKFLFENNPSKALKTSLFLQYKDVKKYNELDGGYLYLIRDKILHPAKNQLSIQQAVSLGQYADSLQNRNVAALFSLINLHPQTTFILVRMPFHSSANWTNELRYQEHLANFKKLSNCTYIDFGTSPSLPDSCFGDADHLNYRGARSFTPLFQKRLW